MGDVKRYTYRYSEVDGELHRVEEPYGHFVLHTDYAALLARHNALREAVKWERECEDFDRWADAMCRAWSCEWDDVVHAARAEVDRLIADCKGEE